MKDFKLDTENKQFFEKITVLAAITEQWLGTFSAVNYGFKS
jgi:hypothetical protein